MDTTGKIKITMEIVGENGLEFLDLKLKIAEGKIRVDACAKPTNSFSYTLANTCYTKKNIWNIPKRMALRLRCICNDDEAFDKRSTEYQNYLIVAKKILRKIYHLLCFLLRLSNLKILLLAVTNVIFARIFLYLTLNANVRLQVEYTISEVNLRVIPLMLFI